jgi:hypothetical protein
MYGYDTGLSFVCKDTGSCQGSGKLNSQFQKTVVMTAEVTSKTAFSSEDLDFFANSIESNVYSNVKSHGSAVENVLSSTTSSRYLQSFVINAPFRTSTDNIHAMELEIETEIKQAVAAHFADGSVSVSLFAVSSALDEKSTASFEDSNGSEKTILETPAFALVVFSVCVLVSAAFAFRRARNAKRHTIPISTTNSGTSSNSGILDDSRLYGAVHAPSPSQAPKKKIVRISKNAISVQSDSKVEKMSQSSVLLQATRKTVAAGSVMSYTKMAESGRSSSGDDDLVVEMPLSLQPSTETTTHQLQFQ